MLDMMLACGCLMIQWGLAKPNQLTFAVIEWRGTIRICAFREHAVSSSSGNLAVVAYRFDKRAQIEGHARPRSSY